MYSHIYIIWEREFVRYNEKVYKIGRSTNINCRMLNYPKSSQIMYIRNVFSSRLNLIENRIKEIFRLYFIEKTEYGSEYFEGNIDDMIDKINIIVSLYNIQYTKNDALVDDECDSVELINEVLFDEELIDDATKLFMNSILDNLFDSLIDNIIKENVDKLSYIDKWYAHFLTEADDDWFENEREKADMYNEYIYSDPPRKKQVVSFWKRLRIYIPDLENICNRVMHQGIRKIYIKLPERKVLIEKFNQYNNGTLIKL